VSEPGYVQCIPRSSWDSYTAKHNPGIQHKSHGKSDHAVTCALKRDGWIDPKRSRPVHVRVWNTLDKSCDEPTDSEIWRDIEEFRRLIREQNEPS
jgi:hypothetical protein